MLVKNDILWYKLSIHRIDLGALSDANGGENREIAGKFREWRVEEKILFESAVTH
jgi:hypothetical protein